MFFRIITWLQKRPSEERIAKAELKIVRKADDDPYHFVSEDIKKVQPYQMKRRHSLPRLSNEPLTEHGTSPVEQEEFIESCLTDVCVVACSDILRRNVSFLSRTVLVLVSQFLHHHQLFCMYKMSCNAMFMT